MHHHSIANPPRQGANASAAGGLIRALAEFQEFGHEFAQPWLARLDIGQGPQQLDRGDADADGKAAVNEAFAEPVREPRREAVPDKLLHDVVGEREPACDGEVPRDEAQQAQDGEEARPAAIDAGRAFSMRKFS